MSTGGSKVTEESADQAAAAARTAEAAAPQAERDAHAQVLKEKGARESAIQLPMNWPHDENGQPMAIAMGQASELVPTVPFGNINIGPAGIMRPVTNHDDLDLLAMEMRAVELLAQYVVGVERRLFQWALDPSTKLEKPSELVSVKSGISFSDFIASKGLGQ
jgi:hypothetical protein